MHFSLQSISPNLATLIIGHGYAKTTEKRPALIHTGDAISAG
jgi:hypothetical protein